MIRPEAVSAAAGEASALPLAGPAQFPTALAPYWASASSAGSKYSSQMLLASSISANVNPSLHPGGGGGHAAVGAVH